MQSTTHVAVALAASTSVSPVVEDAVAGDLRLLLLAVVCALLPDLLERGVRRCARRPDVLVALDPLAPSAEQLAEGVAAAAAWAVLERRPCWLRIQPLPGGARGLAYEPQISFDHATSRVVTTLRDGGREASARLPALHPGWPDRYRIEGPEGLLLRFWPGTDADPRLRCTVLERGWPHGVPFLASVVLFTGVFAGGVAAGVAALVLAAHGLLDQGGLLGVDGLAPFGRKRAPLGWRLWRGASPLTNGALTWLACLVVFWNVSRSTAYLPWRPSLVALLLLGFVLPAILWTRLRRGRSRSTG